MTQSALCFGAKVQAPPVLAEQVLFQGEGNDGVGTTVLQFGKRRHLADPRWPVRPGEVRVLKYQSEKLLHEDVVRYGRRNDFLNKALRPQPQ